MSSIDSQSPRERSHEPRERSILVRCSRTLHQAVLAGAAARNVSLNKFVVDLLREELRDLLPPPAPPCSCHHTVLPEAPAETTTRGNVPEPPADESPKEESPKEEPSEPVVHETVTDPLEENVCRSPKSQSDGRSYWDFI